MSQQSINLPSFDELLQLAASDPEGLENLRQSVVNELIQQRPSDQQPSLRGLQFTIDMERQLAKSPLQGCLRLSTLMHDQVQRLAAAFNHPKTNQATTKTKGADIISFAAYKTKQTTNNPEGNT